MCCAGGVTTDRRSGCERTDKGVPLADGRWQGPLQCAEPLRNSRQTRGPTIGRFHETQIVGHFQLWFPNKIRFSIWKRHAAPRPPLVNFTPFYLLLDSHQISETARVLHVCDMPGAPLVSVKVKCSTSTGLPGRDRRGQGRSRIGYPE